MRKDSLTQRLVLTIVVPVIAVLMTLGLINYWNTKDILNQLNTAEQNFINNEIRSFIELQFVALDIIEEPIQQQMEAYSNKIVNLFDDKDINIATIDLLALRDELGMNNQTYDLYIINTNGEVINTTYKADLGINLYNFGDVYKKYLQRILDEGNFESPKFFFEDKTKKYKKYSYQASSNKQYIIEIGLYSSQADRIFSYMMNHLNDLAKQRRNLADIDLFFWLDKPTSLNPEKEFIADHLNILPYLENDSVISTTYNNKGTIQSEYTYIYVKNINSKLIKGAIIRLKHDTSYQANFKKMELLKFASLILVAIFLAIAIAFLINPLGKAIKHITNISKELALGNLSVNMNSNLKNRNDELGELATAIDSLIANLIKTSEFARQTGKGNFNEKHTLLSDKDVLGKTLIKMQERLTRIKTEEEKALIAEQKNKFIADGNALIGEILRSNTNNINILSEQLIKALVDYLKIPVGAFFVAEEIENKKILESKAAIAYNRLRLFEKRINIGDGLIGQCAFEKLPIYLKEVPQDYIQITSGLGTTNPNFILLVPLIYEGGLFGVIELASFNEFKPYEINFVEKIAESIASTLSSTQRNQRTIQLLEQSRLQQEELSSQEEEMRQNMEELLASQEEASLRENKLSEIINVVNASIFKIEYDASGKILDINQKYLDFLKTNSSALIGKNATIEYELLEIDMNKLEPVWSNLKRGISQKIVQTIIHDKNKIQLVEYYHPISNGDKIIKLSHLG